MSTHAEELSGALLEIGRDIGAERRFDLVLDIVFLRWRTGTGELAYQWNGLRSAHTDAELLSIFTRLTHGEHRLPELGMAEGFSRFAQIVRAVVRLVDDAIDTAELAAEVFEATFEQRHRLDRARSEFDMPSALAVLMAAVTVRPGDVVYDPSCGYASGLLAAARAASGVTVFGHERHSRVAARAAQRLQVHGTEVDHTAVVHHGDAFAAGPLSVDTVITVPPWGLPDDMDRNQLLVLVDRLGMDLHSTRMFGWLMLAAAALNDRGRAAVVLPSRSLDGTRYRHAHRALIEAGRLEAIIALPHGTGGALSRTNTVLWLVRAPGQPTLPDTTVMIDLNFLPEPDSGTGPIGSHVKHFLAETLAAARAGKPVPGPDYVARAVVLGPEDAKRGLWPRLYLAEPPDTVAPVPIPDRQLLTELSVANFKAFGLRTRVPLAPLTLVYGANSAGKSSLLQTLLLLKQSRRHHRLNTQGPMVRAGAFRSLVHKHGGGEMELGLSYGVMPEWIPAGGTPDPTLLRSATWVFTPDEAGHGSAVEARWHFGDHRLSLRRDPHSPYEFWLELAALEPVLRGVARGTLLYPFEPAHVRGANQDRVTVDEMSASRVWRTLMTLGGDSLRGRASDLLFSGEVRLPRGLDSLQSGPFDARAVRLVDRVARLAAGVSAELEHLLDSIVWLGPLRSAPKRVYDRAVAGLATGDGGEVAMYLLDHPSVLVQVNQWLQRLEVPYVLDVMPVAADLSADLVGDLVVLSLQDTRSGVTVTPADVGFGISQILPVVVELLARRDSVIAVEQPETHLHPRLQARLADVLIESTRATGPGNQVIVETHSEHLMLRVQRRIREGTLDPEQVSVVYVDQDATGAGTVEQLRLDENGDFLDDWPHGFFDDRLGELFAEL